MRRVNILLLALLSVLLYQCQKEPISVNPEHKLAFSTDTMVFDTVFTTIGSSTRNFRVYNPNRQSIEISSVRLAGSNNSPFRMNVDGEPTNHARNLVVAPGDSLFVFVEVTIDPNNDNSPLLIMDSIVFETNGNLQDVKLVAWGQDVHLYDSLIVDSYHTITADKPHVIYNYIYVDENATLVIEPGARLHFHNMAVLAVSGTLEVNGEPDRPVVLEGDRLEEFYRDKASQWYGIITGIGSHNNIIKWAVIKNAIIGVMVNGDDESSEVDLRIENSRIENMSGAALHGRGAIIEASNCLFANAAEVVVSLKYGGRYRFIHCTVANYWGYYIHRKAPSVLLNNFHIHDNELLTWDLEAYFGNCIIYGSYSDELEINNTIDDVPVGGKMEYLFESSILRVTDKFDLTNTNHFRSVITDDPKFIKPSEYNYQLDSISPARNIALPSLSELYPMDLNNNSRLSDEGPDLGAFEWVPSEEGR